MSSLETFLLWLWPYCAVFSLGSFAGWYYRGVMDDRAFAMLLDFIFGEKAKEDR